MNGLEFDTLYPKIISTSMERKEIKYKHGEDDDADTPTINTIIISFVAFLIDDFRSQITWGTTHRLIIGLRLM